MTNYQKLLCRKSGIGAFFVYKTFAIIFSKPLDISTPKGYNDRKLALEQIEC